MSTEVVAMLDFEFSPKEVNVAVGDSVVWRNDGSASHTATRDEDPPFDTGLVPSGSQSMPVLFKTAGTFDYFCRPHKGHMKGRVIVR